MSEQLQRGILLLGQHRHALAAEQIAQHLGSNPNDSHAHGLLALCLAESERYSEASEHAAQSITLSPDSAFSHYVAAYVFTERERFEQALAEINEAIRLDPYDADYFALLSRIHLSEKRHQAALAAADQGLAIDAEHIGCQNLRAMALKNLGRHIDAAQALQDALARNPENAVTHANKGWALLEKNQPEEALKHFQEALRIDPTLDWAREGIVTALKARYRLYGVMLKYFLFMRKLPTKQQGMIVLGVWFGSRMLGSLARSNPALAPYILPIRFLLVAFALLSWLADPLFNLALQLNPYGRLALNREQRTASTLVGICIGLCLVSLIPGFFIGFSFRIYAMAAGFGLMALPITAIWQCADGWPRRIMRIYAAVMAVALVLGIASYWLSLHAGQNTGPLATVLMACLAVYLIGAIGVSWVANGLMMWRVRR